MRRLPLRQLASSASHLMEKLNRSAVSAMSSRSNYAAGRCSLMAQPAWRQLQESSMVPPASSQYWLQYFLSFPTRQLHAGCSQFFNSSCMRRPPLTLRFPFRFSGSLNSLMTNIGAYHIPLLTCGGRPMDPPRDPMNVRAREVGISSCGLTISRLDYLQQEPMPPASARRPK